MNKRCNTTWIKREIVDYVLTLDEGYRKRRPEGVKEWMEIMLKNLIKEAQYEKD